MRDLERNQGNRERTRRTLEGRGLERCLERRKREIYTVDPIECAAITVFFLYLFL